MSEDSAEEQGQVNAIKAGHANAAGSGARGGVWSLAYATTITYRVKYRTSEWSTVNEALEYSQHRLFPSAFIHD